MHLQLNKTPYANIDCKQPRTIPTLTSCGRSVTVSYSLSRVQGTRSCTERPSLFEPSSHESVTSPKVVFSIDATRRPHARHTPGMTCVSRLLGAADCIRLPHLRHRTKQHCGSESNLTTFTSALRLEVPNATPCCYLYNRIES